MSMERTPLACTGRRCDLYLFIDDNDDNDDNVYSAHIVVYI